MVDDFIGRRFGKDDCMEVIGWDGGRDKSNSRLYTIKCHVCAQDKELFGEGLFKSRKGSMLKGQIPCGCSVAPKWNSEQYDVLIKRLCKKRNYEFNGFVDTRVCARTKVHLKCNTCSLEWSSTTVNDFQNGKGCLTCGTEARSISRRTPDDEMIASFLATGKYKQGTKFKRLEKGNLKKILWEVLCPTCSTDEYVEAGLCTGIFTSVSDNLKKGQMPCRCSPNFTWTREQREYQIEKRVKDDRQHYSFVEWAGNGYHGAFSKFSIRCPTHGTWEAGVDKFINSGQRCPTCAKGGFSPQKEGSVYVLQVQGVTTDFTGYGISNVPKRRISDHVSNLADYGFRIESQQVFTMQGQKAVDIENLLKSTFPRYPQEVEGFKREATHAHLYQDVISFVKQTLDSPPTTL